MLKNIVTSVAIVGSIFTTNVSAGDLAKIFTECGLGGLIAQGVEDKDNGVFTAVSTNVTWDLGTTASSTYYSSGKDSCANRRAKVAVFINESFEKLEKEIAQGNGKYLESLANLAVEKKADRLEYTSILRKKFASVVADKSYSKLSNSEKAERLYSIAI